MKFSPINYLISGLLLLCSCAKSQQHMTNPAPQYKLVFDDEFDYKGLPDSTKWTYEEGFTRNHESEYYTYARPQNAWVHDGYLEIKAIKEDYPNKFYKRGSTNWTTSDSLAHYTSACLVTLGKESWKYGKIEVRAKIPHGQGIWPAIWMLGTDEARVGWPLCGETDIMEYIGRDSTHIYGTMHYASASGAASNGNKLETFQPYNSFHVYGLEWDSTKMKTTFDSTVYQTFFVDEANFKDDNPYRKPFYLLLNLALGGSWGGPVADSVLPQSFLIDYVRVYQQVN